MTGMNDIAASPGGSRSSAIAATSAWCEPARPRSPGAASLRSPIATAISTRRSRSRPRARGPCSLAANDDVAFLGSGQKLRRITGKRIEEVADMPAEDPVIVAVDAGGAALTSGYSGLCGGRCAAAGAGCSTCPPTPTRSLINEVELRALAVASQHVDLAITGNHRARCAVARQSTADFTTRVSWRRGGTAPAERCPHRCTIGGRKPPAGTY